MSAPDVLVIGAGITGAAAALAAVEAGASVDLVDVYAPAAMASGWTLGGVRQSGRDPAELPLARAAVALWPDLAARLGAATHYRQEGNLRLARSADELAVLRRLVDAQGRLGLALELVGPDDLRHLAPALAPGLVGASWCPSDGHADPVATVAAFVRAAQGQGVRLRTGHRIDRLEVAGGRVVAAHGSGDRIAAGAVLVAAGTGVNALLAPLGVAVPLRTPMVTVVRSAPVAPCLGPVVGVARADLAIRQEAGGALRFTGGPQAWTGAVAEEGGRPVIRPPLGRVAETIATAAAVLPVVADAPVAAVWGGTLDLTPDALPVVDRVPGCDNLVVAAGFSGHGFGIGPVTGPLAADLALGRPPAHALDAFRFGRFEADAPRVALTLPG